MQPSMQLLPNNPLTDRLNLLRWTGMALILTIMLVLNTATTRSPYQPRLLPNITPSRHPQRVQQSTSRLLLQGLSSPKVFPVGVVPAESREVTAEQVDGN